jgi:hypothetical protein
VPICFAVVMLFVEILYRFGDTGGEIMHVKHLPDKLAVLFEMSLKHFSSIY